MAPIHAIIGSKRSDTPFDARVDHSPVILVLRLYAMHDGKTILLRALLLLLAVQVCTEVAIIGPIVAHQKCTCDGRIHLDNWNSI